MNIEMQKVQRLLENMQADMILKRDITGMLVDFFAASFENYEASRTLDAARKTAELIIDRVADDHARISEQQDDEFDAAVRGAGVDAPIILSHPVDRRGGANVKIEGAPMPTGVFESVAGKMPRPDIQPENEPACDHESDGIIYTSNPAQLRCKKCGEWYPSNQGVQEKAQYKCGNCDNKINVGFLCWECIVNAPPTPEQISSSKRWLQKYLAGRTVPCGAVGIDARVFMGIHAQGCERRQQELKGDTKSTREQDKKIRDNIVWRLRHSAHHTPDQADACMQGIIDFVRENTQPQESCEHGSETTAVCSECWEHLCSDCQDRLASTSPD